MPSSTPIPILRHRTEGGNTPLLLAAKRGHTKTVKKLFELGTNVSQANCHGDTTLHLTHSSEIAEALINAQADVNALNTRNETPLHSRDSDSLATARCLLDAGANVNAQDSKGHSLLHKIVLVYCFETEIFDLLLEYTADLTLTDDRGRTPLQLARAWRRTECAGILKKHPESHTKVTAPQ